MTMGRNTQGREPLAVEPRGPWGTILVWDADGPIGFKTGIFGDAVPIPVGWKGALVFDTSVPLFFIQGATLTLDIRAPLSWKQAVVGDTHMPLGFQQGITLSLVTNAPILWRTGLVLDSSMPLAWSGFPSLIGDVLRPASPIFVLVPQRPRGS